jgi:hypothetical protein
MVHCAMLMLAVQVFGLHYHRHATTVDVLAAEGVSVHHWDASEHVPSVAESSPHTSGAELIAHSEADVDINQFAAGLIKLIKVCLVPVLLFFAVLWHFSVLLLTQIVTGQAVVSAPPILFALRPPANAPPLMLSLAR